MYYHWLPVCYSLYISIHCLHITLDTVTMLIPAPKSHWVVLFGSSKEAVNLLETMSTTEDQQTALDLLFGESRRLCIEARETQTATELLLRRSRLLLEETKRLHKTLHSTIKRSDQLCKEALELQVGVGYLRNASGQR